MNIVGVYKSDLHGGTQATRHQHGRGRGRSHDKVFVERLWKTVKYEEVCLKGHESMSQAKKTIRPYLAFYNQRRPRPALDGQTLDQAYFIRSPLAQAAQSRQKFIYEVGHDCSKQWGYFSGVGMLAIMMFGKSNPGA